MPPEARRKLRCRRRRDHLGAATTTTTATLLLIVVVVAASTCSSLLPVISRGGDGAFVVYAFARSSPPSPSRFFTKHHHPKSKGGEVQQFHRRLQQRRYFKNYRCPSSSTTTAPSGELADDGRDDDDSQNRRPRRFFGNHRDLSVPAILLADFLSLLGTSMTSPIQPAIGRHFSLPMGASFGSLSSAYPLGMTLGVSLWPTLSDNASLGRKAVMATILCGSAMGLASQARGMTRGWTLEAFLAARVLTGFFAGSVLIGRAFMADKASELLEVKAEKSGDGNGDGSEDDGNNLAKFLAWKDAAATLAYIVGPGLGGFAYQLFGRRRRGGGVVASNSDQIAFVICCSALASLSASFAVALMVKNVEVQTKGTINGKVRGRVDDDKVNGRVNGNVSSDVNGQANGNIHGKINGNAYDKINEDVNSKGHGKVNGSKVHGRVDDGKVNGQVNGNVNSDVNGQVNENIHGKINGNAYDKINEDVNGKGHGKLNGEAKDIVNGVVHEKVSENVAGSSKQRLHVNGSDIDVDTKSERERRGWMTDKVSCPLGTKPLAGIASVACVTALYHAADSAFFAFFPALLQSRLNFDTQATGMALTSSAVVSFAMSAFASSRFLRRFGPVAACATGLGAVGTGLTLLGFASSLPAAVGGNMGPTASLILGASALHYAGASLYGPSIPMMLFKCVPPHKRGAVMGLAGAINTLARSISPLIMGEIHRAKGPGACFGVAGSCVYAAASICLLRRWQVVRKTVLADAETVDDMSQNRIERDEPRRSESAIQIQTAV